VLIDNDHLSDDLGAALEGIKLDIAVDSVGGPASTALANHLDYQGTLISYGIQSGQPPTISPVGLLANHSYLTGFWLMNWLIRTSDNEIIETYQQPARLAANGTISAGVQRTMSLDNWPEALSLASEYQRAGKILFVFPASHDV
jgi:NADPH:quinone reductase-like Zn-dependent oxidoreductase